MATVRDRRVAFIALAMLIVGVTAPVFWFFVASSGTVREIRALEDRAIRVIEELRTPELELRYGPTRKSDAEIRKAWAFSLIGSPDLLTMFLDHPSWRPGQGTGVTAMYRSDVDMRGTCLRLARHIGEPDTRCPDMGPDEQDTEYWLPIDAEGAWGGIYIYLRRLRNAQGELEDDFSVVAEFSVHACGTLREPGSGPCP